MTGLRVGLVGLGTVGTEVARGLIDDNAFLVGASGRPISLHGAAVRDTAKKRDVDLGNAVISADADALAGAESIDVLVELMGGIDGALRVVRAALENGKSVVTANKQLIAAHGVELHELATDRGVQLRFSAAVGGGTPILELLSGALRGDHPHEIVGILNGTTNLLLGSMAGGESFEDALSDAQQRGFAEADPSEDVDGLDAAAKLAICASLLWQCRVSRQDVTVRGLRDVAREDLVAASALGYVVKLLARALYDGERLSLTVRPTLVPLDGSPLSALAQLVGGGNGIVVTTDRNEPVTLLGAGAGGAATASAVLSDIVAIARGETVPAWLPGPIALAGAEERETGAYLRIRLNAKPDAANLVAQQLEDRGVAVTATVETERGELIVLTGETAEAVLDRAIETLETVAAVRSVEARLDYAEGLR